MGLPLYVNITPRVADTAPLNLSKYMSAELPHFSESSSRVRYAWQQVLSVHTSAPPLPHGLPPREAIFRAVYVRAATDCAFSASSAHGCVIAVRRRRIAVAFISAARYGTAPQHQYKKRYCERDKPKLCYLFSVKPYSTHT